MSGRGGAAAGLRVLALGVHPDDLEVYAGGLLLRLLGAGAEVLPLVLTDGEAGTLQPREGTRREEGERALAVQGLVGRFVGLPDGRLGREKGCGHDELVRVLAGELRWARPGLVLGPHKGDQHRDHAAVGQALGEAILGAGLGQVACLHWLGAEPGELPNFFVGVSEVFEDKLEWIRAHASQLPGPGGPRGHLPGGRDLVERAISRETRYGRAMGLGLAEPFLAKARPLRLCSLLGACLFTGEEA